MTTQDNNQRAEEKAEYLDRLRREERVLEQMTDGICGTCKWFDKNNIVVPKGYEQSRCYNARRWSRGHRIGRKTCGMFAKIIDELGA